MPAHAARCYARQSLLHAFFLTTLIRLTLHIEMLRIEKSEASRDARVIPAYITVLLFTAETLHFTRSEL